MSEDKAKPNVHPFMAMLREVHGPCMDEIADLRARLQEAEIKIGILKHELDDYADSIKILSKLDDESAEVTDILRTENASLRKQLSIVINFVPEGWPMPLLWSIVVRKAKEILGEVKE